MCRSICKYRSGMIKPNIDNILSNRVIGEGEIYIYVYIYIYIYIYIYYLVLKLD